MLVINQVSKGMVEWPQESGREEGRRQGSSGGAEAWDLWEEREEFRAAGPSTGFCPSASCSPAGTVVPAWLPMKIDIPSCCTWLSNIRYPPPRRPRCSSTPSPREATALSALLLPLPLPLSLDQSHLHLCPCPPLHPSTQVSPSPPCLTSAPSPLFTTL